MRLESDGLLQVKAGSLVGSTARTPKGDGKVIAVRDVSVRCKVETVSVNKAKTVRLTKNAGEVTCNETGDETDVHALKRQLAMSVNETQTCLQPCTIKHGISTPGVMGGLASSLGRDLFHEDRDVFSTRRGKGGEEATSRAKRRSEGHGGDKNRQIEQRDDHAMSSSGGPERCLNGLVPEVKRGALRWVAGNDSWADAGDDDDVQDDCSVRTETAAQFDNYTEGAVNDRTQGDFGPRQAGAGSWNTHSGDVPQGS